MGCFDAAKQKKGSNQHRPKSEGTSPFFAVVALEMGVINLVCAGIAKVPNRVLPRFQEINHLARPEKAKGCKDFDCQKECSLASPWPMAVQLAHDQQ